MKLSDWKQQEQVVGLEVNQDTLHCGGGALGMWTPENLKRFHNALRMVAKEELHYTRQKDKTKPHLYFMEGKWHYRSAWMGFDYINGPSEERNNQAMLWCWNQNYNKPIDNEIVFS